MSTTVDVKMEDGTTRTDAPAPAATTAPPPAAVAAPAAAESGGTAATKRPAEDDAANSGGVVAGGVVPKKANTAANSQLQQQIQQQLQSQLQAQLQAAAARGQQANITPEQIQVCVLWYLHVLHPCPFFRNRLQNEHFRRSAVVIQPQMMTMLVVECIPCCRVCLRWLGGVIR
jgi:hypothetical protein